MKVQRIGLALASMAAASVLMAGTAGAQVSPYVFNNTTTTTTASTTTTTTGDVLPNNEVAPQPVLAFTDEPKATAGPSLAFTGADVAELSVVGAGMIALGTVMSRKRRKATVKVNS